MYTNINDDLIYSTDNSKYETYKKQSKAKHNIKCIDGKITGCGNYIGFCKYEGHLGFITPKLLKKHDCIKKNCDYFYAKPVCGKRQKVIYDNQNSEYLLHMVQEKMSGMEGIRVLNAVNDDGKWILNYITISNFYLLDSIAESIQESTGISVVFHNLNYSFDKCVQLLLQCDSDIDEDYN